MKFHSLFSWFKWGAFLGGALLYFSCTSAKDIGYVYGSLKPAYYPQRLHIPMIIDLQKNAKRERIKFEIKEANSVKNRPLVKILTPQKRGATQM